MPNADSLRRADMYRDKANSPVTDAAAVTGENLALLYQGVLTSIVRVQSGRQPITDSNAFRKRIKDVLGEIEREAARLGYNQPDISDTSYAVVAFLDEAVLNSNDPNRTAWSSLQADMYERNVAGEAFFDRLANLRKKIDSPRLADFLEVYYLCLLLGYEGRYAVGELRAELRQIMEELALRIERTRGKPGALSPSALLPASAGEPVAAPPSGTRKCALVALAGAGLLLMLWVLLNVLLGASARDVAEGLKQALVP